jgi:hypothetical protein
MGRFSYKSHNYNNSTLKASNVDVVLGIKPLCVHYKLQNLAKVAYMKQSLIYCLRSDDMKVGTFIRSSLDSINKNVRSLI